MMHKLDKYKESPDERKVRTSNFWYTILVTFICLWLVGLFFYFEKGQLLKHTEPVVAPQTSFWGFDFTNFSKTLTDLSSTNHSAFVSKDEYEVGDIVLMEPFHKIGKVKERSMPSSETYVVIYEDHSGTLREIIVPRVFLLAPADENLKNLINVLHE